MKKKIMALEIIFSCIVIAIIFFIITLICLEIKSYSQRINRKAEASIIGSNILENMKARSYDEIDTYINELSFIGIEKRIEGTVQYVTVTGNEFNEKFFGTEIPNGFVIELQTENYGKEFDILKKISLNVIYTIGKKSEKISLSTILERELIDECNAPIITDEYFKEFEINNLNYQFIPIKYSESKNSFVTTTTNDVEWFNYSAKRWAKILVFPAEREELKYLFINDDGTVNKTIIYNNQNLNIENYIYVWIPNFTIQDDISYFRYKTEKRIIKMDLLYVNGSYLYLNRAGEEIKDISPECSFEGMSGVWRKLGDEEDEYYKNFNLTKYAPINIY